MTAEAVESAWASIIAAGVRLGARGLAPGASGNVSVRVGDELLITPTGCELAALGSTEPSRLDLGGQHLSGPRPSKEWPMHLGLLRARPDAGAVVHLHSTHAVAVSCLADLEPDDVLPPLTAYFVMRVGRLALVPYLPPGDPGLGPVVERAAGASHALLLANHGSLVAGQDITAAQQIAEELEETARIFLLLQGLRTRPLSTSQVDGLRPDSTAW